VKSAEEKAASKAKAEVSDVCVAIGVRVAVGSGMVAVGEGIASTVWVINTPAVSATRVENAFGFVVDRGWG
jgi:hypothetical protein